MTKYLLILMLVGTTQLDSSNLGTETSDDDEATSKYAQEETAQIKATYELFAYLDTLGISSEDIDPNNLPFEATDYVDCLRKAVEFFEAKDNRAVAEAQCLYKYPPEWAIRHRKPISAE